MSRTAMMCLSQTTGYAIHALSCIEDSSGQTRFIREIAVCSRIPRPYLAKIINQLAHQGIVSAKRGYRGGIVLGRPAREISLLQIVEAVEGERWIGDCLLGLVDCAARRACPTQRAWQRIRRDIREVLRRTTLADVIRSTRRDNSRSAESRRRPSQPRGASLAKGRRATPRRKRDEGLKPEGEAFPSQVLRSHAPSANLQQPGSAGLPPKTEKPPAAPAVTYSPARRRPE